MIVCHNCGAQIEYDVDKYPYCGYINLEEAEKKYLDELIEIKENLNSIEKEPVKALKKGLSKSVRLILSTLGVL